MKKAMPLIAMFVLSLAIAVQAQTVRHQQDPATKQAAIEAKQQYVGTSSPDATTACSFTFTSGTGNTFLKYCVTANGNIVQFESPSGHEHIATAPIGEGYAFCDFDSSTQYFDYAGYGDSGNWQAPVTVSTTATSVKISRKTTDGIYTLTQTITQNKGSALAQVTMALKNNSTNSHHVGLLRFADIDADGSSSNAFDFTFRTAFGYSNYGLQLAFVSGSAFNGSFSQNIPGGPNPCQIFAHTQGPFSGDGSVFSQVDMQLAKSATGTFVVTYKSF